MKKSKIIIPALAVLTLSTAAAVSGTVAWFSASRETSLSLNTAVINPEGALACDLTAGQNVTVDDSAVALIEDYYLRDASVAIDGEDATVYSAVINDDETVKEFKEVASPYAYNEDPINGNYIVYAATWAGEFYLKDSSTTDPYTVFFDATSVFTYTSSQAVQKAFRLAMYNENFCVVWAPASEGATVTYVNGTASTAIGTYDNVKGTSRVTQETASATRAKVQLGDCYGQYSGEDKLLVNFVMWYEGTDANCDTEHLAANATSSATSTLKFNAIQKDLLAA